MRTTLTIFKKELLDITRDRRTIITMVLLPLLLFPVLISVSTRLAISEKKKAESRTLKVALISPPAQDFRSFVEDQSGVEIEDGIAQDDLERLIRDEELDGAYVFDEGFQEKIAQGDSGGVSIFFKGTSDSRTLGRRLRTPVEQYEESVVSRRFSDLDLDRDITKAVSIKETNLATKREIYGTIAGGFIPYIFILFCFTGAMYPAIDLGAGEKERGTLETLLATPAGRFEILAGKFGVIVLTGILAAIVSMIGLFLSVQLSHGLPDEAMSVIDSILEMKLLVLLLSLLLPLTVFFAGIMLSLSMFAKSFKEAQSTINPLLIVVILPAAVGMLPGIELNATTALIPILNVSLATKAIIAETITVWLLLEVYASLFALAAAGLLFCARWFDREEVVFR